MSMRLAILYDHNANAAIADDTVRNYVEPFCVSHTHLKNID